MHHAKTVQTASPNMEYGHIISREASLFLVNTSFGEVSAVRAASCLLEPASGDKVLLAVDIHGGAYVLAVLERDESLAAELAVDGDARLTARGGSLTLTAERDLALACGDTLSAVADSVTVHAGRGAAVIERLSVVGRSLKTRFKRVKSVAQSVDLACRSYTQRLTESFRFVKEHDEVQAGSQRVLVEELMALHAKNHSVMAEEQVVINAEQIHLG